MVYKGDSSSASRRANCACRPFPEEEKIQWRDTVRDLYGDKKRTKGGIIAKYVRGLNDIIVFQHEKHFCHLQFPQLYDFIRSNSYLTRKKSMILDHVGSVKMSSILTLIISTKNKSYETVWHHKVIAYWSFTTLFPFVCLPYGSESSFAILLHIMVFCALLVPDCCENKTHIF